MKRYVSLLLVIMFVVAGFCGCISANKYSTVTIANSDEITEGIRNAMLNRTESFKVTFSAYTLDEDGIFFLVDNFMDNAFYDSEMPNAGDYLRYQYGGYTLTHKEEKGLLKYKYTLRITPSYYTDIEEESVVNEIIAQAIKESGLSNNSSDIEKIEWVHDFICNTVSYDTVHKHTPGSGHVQSTAYSALYYHTALCQGYAVLCYRLLKELGIDNRIVTGTATVQDNVDRHAWNIVKINDCYYNLDVTMDDVNSSNKYFLKTDEIFSADHTRDDKFLSADFYENYPMAKENYL